MFKSIKENFSQFFKNFSLISKFVWLISASLSHFFAKITLSQFESQFVLFTRQIIFHFFSLISHFINAKYFFSTFLFLICSFIFLKESDFFANNKTQDVSASSLCASWIKLSHHGFFCSK